jgi:hypothetical protein
MWRAQPHCCVLAQRPSIAMSSTCARGLGGRLHPYRGAGVRGGSGNLEEFAVAAAETEEQAPLEAPAAGITAGGS